MHNKTDEFSPLTLAFVGDGVYDLLVREYLVRQANRPVGELNRVKVAMVNCRSQAQFAAKLMRTSPKKRRLSTREAETPRPNPPPKTARSPNTTAPPDWNACSATCI